MTTTNPELDQAATTLSERVKYLFGSAPPVIVRAVARFLEKDPGELDHHNLRTIAAAAKAVGDPQLVAELIDGMPVTQMYVAAKPMNLRRDRRDFEEAMRDLPTVTCRDLVGDLVQKTSIDVLGSIPAQRLSPPAREVINEHLRSQLQGSVRDLAGVTASLVADRTTIDRALDEIERRMDRGDEPIPFAVIGPALLQVLADGSERVSDEQLNRAWSISQRCDDRHEFGMYYMNAIVSNSRLVALRPEGVLDDIYQMRSNAWISRQLSGRMLCVPGLPESVARRIVADGPLLWATSPSEKTPANQSFRLAALRMARYRRGADNPDLPMNMTSQELDRMIADLPEGRIGALAIREMTDTTALDRLWARRAELTDDDVRALAGNVHITFDAVEALRRAKRSTGRTGVGVEGDRNVGLLVTNPKLDDEQIAQAIRSASRRERVQLIRRALTNPSAGSQVLDLANQRGEAVSLSQFARSVTSRELQDELATIAIERGDTDLASCLLSNAMLRNDVAGRLPPAHDSLPEARQGSFYGPADVLELVKNGEARPAAIDSLVLGYWDDRHGEADLAECREAVEELANLGLLKEHHWHRLTDAVDRHVAMRFASHVNCPPDASVLTTVASDKLEDTMQAISVGLQRDEGKLPKVWDDLPNRLDVPLPRSPQTELVDGQIIESAKLSVPATLRALRAESQRMGNCLDGFADALSKQRAVVAYTRQGERTLAAAWSIDQFGHMQIVDVNTDYNTNDVPPEFRAGIERLTVGINNGSIRPVAERVVDADSKVQMLDSHDTLQKAVIRHRTDGLVVPHDGIDTDDVPEPPDVETAPARRRRPPHRGLRLQLAVPDAASASPVAPAPVLSTPDDELSTSGVLMARDVTSSDELEVTLDEDAGSELSRGVLMARDATVDDVDVADESIPMGAPDSTEASEVATTDTHAVQDDGRGSNGLDGHTFY